MGVAEEEEGGEAEEGGEVEEEAASALVRAAVKAEEAAGAGVDAGAGRRPSSIRTLLRSFSRHTSRTPGRSRHCST